MTGLVLLTVIATVLSGNHRVLPVMCNVAAEPGVDGYVYLRAGPVHLRPEWCEALLARSEDEVGGYAALVLGHEVGHFVLNTRDEMRAECWGLRHVKLVARLLGWDPVRTFRDAAYRSFCGVKP